MPRFCQRASGGASPERAGRVSFGHRRGGTILPVRWAREPRRGPTIRRVNLTKGESMMRRVVGSAIAALALCAVVGAQQPQAPPKPGPEQQLLGFFVGKWKTETEMKPSPFGPGGKTTGNDTCEWFTGGFQVVCRGTGTGSAGKMSSLAVMAYSAGDKAYTNYFIDNSGISNLSKGNKSGNTWTFS